MEKNAGYTIKEAVTFENGAGFAFGENQKAPNPFVTWQFTVNDRGKRDYFWGHYFNDGNRARADLQARAADYKRRYIDPPELKNPTHGHDDR